MINYTFDVGGTGTKCIVFDEQQEKNYKYLLYPLEKIDKVKKQVSLITILDEISKVLDQVDEQFNLAIALPGMIDTKNKKILCQSAVSSIDIDINDYFKKYKNINKFIIVNDANAAAWGEFNYRKNFLNQKIDNMMHITIGTGVGCGLIINQKVLKGNNFQTGEIGRMYSNIKESDQDSVTFDVGMRALLIKYYMATEKQVTGEELFELYIQKNPVAINLINMFTSQIAKLIINCDFLLDLDLITVGGGVSSNETFTQLLVEKINKYKDFYYQDKVLYSNDYITKKFSAALLANKAACYGCLYYLKQGGD